MRTVLTACAAVMLALPTAGNATQVVLFDDFVTADATVPAPAGATAALAGPGGLVGGLQSGAVNVTAPGPGYLFLSVTDVGFVGDVFEALVDGASVGTTSHVPINGPDNSTGNFVVPVTAGAHAVDLWDYVLSFIGSDSPYGGAVDDTFSPADVSLTVTYVPEPATMALLGTGLFGLGFVRRRFAR